MDPKVHYRIHCLFPEPDGSQLGGLGEVLTTPHSINVSCGVATAFLKYRLRKCVLQRVMVTDECFQRRHFQLFSSAFHNSVCKCWILWTDRICSLLEPCNVLYICSGSNTSYLDRLIIRTDDRNAIKLHVQVFVRMNTWMLEICRRRYNEIKTLM
jgi:hypothetical protein